VGVQTRFAAGLAAAVAFGKAVFAKIIAAEGTFFFEAVSAAVFAAAWALLETVIADVAATFLTALEVFPAGKTDVAVAATGTHVFEAVTTDFFAADGTGAAHAAFTDELVCAAGTAGDIIDTLAAAEVVGAFAAGD